MKNKNIQPIEMIKNYSIEIEELTTKTDVLVFWCIALTLMVLVMGGYLIFGDNEKRDNGNEGRITGGYIIQQTGRNDNSDEISDLNKKILSLCQITAGCTTTYETEVQDGTTTIKPEEVATDEFKKIKSTEKCEKPEYSGHYGVTTVCTKTYNK